MPTAAAPFLAPDKATSFSRYFPARPAAEAVVGRAADTGAHSSGLAFSECERQPSDMRLAAVIAVSVLINGSMAGVQRRSTPVTLPLLSTFRMGPGKMSLARWNLGRLSCALRDEPKV